MQTPADWRRLVALHHKNSKVARLSFASGQRGAFMSAAPDVELAPLEISGGPPLVRTAEFGATTPGDLADSLWKLALESGEAIAEEKGSSAFRLRLELYNEEHDTLAESAVRRVQLEQVSELQDDDPAGAAERQKQLHAMTLLRHTDHQSRRLFALNLEQAQRVVDLAGRMSEQSEAHSQALISLVNAVADMRDREAQPLSIDPDVQREGLAVLKTWLTMRAQSAQPKAEQRAAPPATHLNSEAIAQEIEKLENDGDLLELDELDESACAMLRAWMRSPVSIPPDARAVLADKLGPATLAKLASMPGMLAKLKPLGDAMGD